MREYTTPDDFFVAGGTMRGYAHSYIKRVADDELFHAISRGREFCYVLTPRQMGKSSLMIRTRNLLEDLTFRTAIIDITQIGVSASEEQWYQSLFRRLQSQLRLSTDVQTWWEDRINLSPVNRFSHFLREVVLNEIEQSVAIFIDEIDATLGLSFADEFFAVIRAAYNARANDPAYNRLAFILLGVATPNDLVKDPDKAPFNIGKRIDLREFSQEDAQLLKQGLQQYIPQDVGPIFDRVFYWTNGHPYLTQKLCLEIASSGSEKWTTTQVDHLVTKLFLSGKGYYEPNIQFMRDYIENSLKCLELLKLYQRVYKGEEVVETERSPIQNQLKLIGLLRVETGKPPRKLIIRNQIYKNVFNQEWIRATMPPSALRKTPALIAAAVFLVILVAVIGYSFIPSINPSWAVTSTVTQTLTTEIVSSATQTTAPSTSTRPSTGAPELILTTPPPANTPTFTPTAESTEIPIAVANQFARIFRSANSNSEELGNISKGERVEVLGRSIGRFDSVSGNPGFYIRTEGGVEGFVIFLSLDWSGVLLDLPIIVMTKSSASLFEEPDPNSGRLKRLSADQPIEFLGISPDFTWLHVNARDNVKGYISVFDVEIEELLILPPTPENN